MLATEQGTSGETARQEGLSQGTRSCCGAGRPAGWPETEPESQVARVVSHGGGLPSIRGQWGAIEGV